MTSLIPDAGIALVGAVVGWFAGRWHQRMRMERDIRRHMRWHFGGPWLLLALAMLGGCKDTCGESCKEQSNYFECLSCWSPTPLADGGACQCNCTKIEPCPMRGR